MAEFVVVLALLLVPVVVLAVAALAARDAGRR